MEPSVGYPNVEAPSPVEAQAICLDPVAKDDAPTMMADPFATPSISESAA